MRIRLSHAVTVAILATACGDSPTPPPVEPPPQDSVTPPSSPPYGLLAVDTLLRLTVVDTASGSHRALTADSLAVGASSWSPDLTHIAFVARPVDTLSTAPRPARLYVVDSAGTQLRAISDTTVSVASAPTWAPVGNRLAYSTSASEMYSVGINGSDVRHLTPGPLTGQTPHYSSNGEWIVYAGDDEIGRQGILRVRSDASERQLLRETDGRGTGPRFSPDASRIAFVDGEDIWVMDADGSNAGALTSADNTRENSPRWSPDGTRIAFGRDFRAAEVIDATSGAVIAPLPGTGSRPVWSPDGLRIAFESQGEVGIVEVGDPRNVRSLMEGTFPSWFPNR